MPILVNLRHLEDGPLRLEDDISCQALDMENVDEVLRARGPLSYDLEAAKVGAGILVSGSLSMPFEADCVRCLRKFPIQVEVTDWTCLVPLEGEECVKVVDDCVDLTPFLREDILLALPQHPLCDPGCGGLPQASASQAGSKTGSSHQESSSAWDTLNKLQF